MLSRGSLPVQALTNRRGGGVRAPSPAGLRGACLCYCSGLGASDPFSPSPFCSCFFLFKTPSARRPEP